jgi:hypothetical protein
LTNIEASFGAAIRAVVMTLRYHMAGRWRVCWGYGGLSPTREVAGEHCGGCLSCQAGSLMPGELPWLGFGADREGTCRPGV